MRWPSGEVSPLNIAGWRDFPLRARLAADFTAEVRIHNDAVCLAIAEHWRGAASGTRNMLGLVVSTGVGGGLILGGRLIDGASGNAGHFGHVIVDDETPCTCGAIGCVEAVASGPNLVDWAYQRGWRKGADRHLLTARLLSLDAYAPQRNPIAIDALRRAGTAVGKAIASATALCDLEVVTVGGGVSQAGPLLFEPMREAVHRHSHLSFARNLRVEPALFGQEAGLIGAAALVLRGSDYWS